MKDYIPMNPTPDGSVPGRFGKSEDTARKWSGGTVKDPMSNMHILPASVVKEYAKQDVNLTLKLWNLFDKKLDEVLYIKDDGEQKTCRNLDPRHSFD